MAESGFDDTSDYMHTMRERFETARTGWQDAREDFRLDLRYVNGDPATQWNSLVKSDRDEEGVPALTMDRLNPLINQIVNKSRKDRPEPKIQPADEGDPQTAEVLEGKIRHLLYESHASVAFDYAEAYCASGGFGFYRITAEYVGKRGTKQEPRLKRIPDPLAVYFDPNVEELDFSDARYCFVRKKYTREQFKKEFGSEPQSFPFEGDTYQNWGNEKNVWVAEYWWVEEIDHRYVELGDGRAGLDTDVGDFGDEDVLNERPVKERIVHCDIVDGAKRLEENTFPCEWIGIVPVIGQERISEGRRRFISAVRYARDPQSFINASFSSTAEAMASKNMAPFTGPKGAFKDKKWRDGKRHFYLEYEPMDAAGRPIEPGAVQRLIFEPAIQGSTNATLQGIDALKGALGYVDSVSRPSQADLSGIAVEKRDDQANLSNTQYEDSLVDSMWHCGRILLDMLLTLADTPRAWQVRKEDGSQRAVPVTMQVDEGVSPEAPGFEGQPHTQIDAGEYGVVINPGPSYATKSEEEIQFLVAVVQSNPQLFPLYADLIFKKRGYEDLEERARLLLPPPIQQAMQDQQQGKDPAAQAQIAQLQAQLQQAIQMLKEAGMEKQAKMIETQGKIQLEKLKFMRELAVEGMKHGHASAIENLKQRHDATKHMLTEHTDAIEHTVDAALAANQAAQAAQQPQQGAGQ